MGRIDCKIFDYVFDFFFEKKELVVCKWCGVVK